ncbi:MAG: metal-dependent hydrolase [Candidatus Levybacteria bacterium]|nr:metal-dependent hydrolase [Candidatus Levybacteria bacterium]
MAGRTHDLGAFTALTYTVATQPLHEMTLATAIVAFLANMVGGLAPDIDQPTGNLWNRVRGGRLVSRLVTPLLGGHRFISHSLLGILLFGFVVSKLLDTVSSVLLVDMNIVWWAFMIGFVSHLMLDTLSREGVPWLFPIPIRIGIPPFRFLRIKTGGIVEKSFAFPMLLIANIYMYYIHYPKFMDFLRHYIK